ncbi:amidohydrolase family protein [Rhodococcus yunnanensis]|uniref:Amidohydrolase family protein n=2 Tax=Rhodococcoides yunnanense TaxID=278209 RepID=A0ABU4BKA0_9NOCA|nr:amidohydrolase family protein [Rhodococcus yunnanensis]MDV6264644.1 amidohydrolase family protein [Rhodococcus yunnanensis]
MTGHPLTVRTQEDRISAVSPGLAPRRGETVIDARGGAVIPGLHDHHIHLRAAVTSAQSVDVGPPNVQGPDRLREVLASAYPRRDGWVRAVGYHDSVAGSLNRRVLDGIQDKIPVRVQHRSGAMWYVNSAGLQLLGLPDHPTGQLFRHDAELVALSGSGPIDYSNLSAHLSILGVTGVTDATPNLSAGELDSLDDAARCGDLRQHVTALSPNSGRRARTITYGPIKRILDDDALDLDELTGWIRDIHDRDYAIALHCVTTAQMVVTTTALRTAGTRVGDRIEHGAMIPDALLPELAELAVTVVTQPNFVAERGDEYLAEVAPAEQNELWRVASLQNAGVAVAGSTDAPFGRIDPWASMRAARDRRSPRGVLVNGSEALSAHDALRLFLGHSDNPASERRISPGARADLCLLSEPPDTILRDLSADHVSMTIIRGQIQ